MSPLLIILGVFVPLVIACVIAPIALFRGKDRPVALPLAAIVSICAGLPILIGKPELQPVIGENWLYHIALAAFLVAIVAQRSRNPLLTAIPLAALGYFVVHTPLARADMGDSRALWTAAIIASFAIPVALVHAANREQSARLGLMLGMGFTVGATAVGIILAHGAKLAQAEGLLGLMLLPAAAVIFFRPSLPVTGVAAVFFAVHTSIVWLAHFYQDGFPLWAAVAATAAPALAAIPGLILKPTRGKYTLAAIQAAVAIAVAALAPLFVVRAAPPADPSDPSQADPYSGAY